MPMEQEVMPMLVIGVSTVMLVAFIITSGQWVVTKNAAHAWIVGHLVVLSLSIALWLYLLSGPEVPSSMESGEYSLGIGFATVLIK